MNVYSWEWSIIFVLSFKGKPFLYYLLYFIQNSAFLITSLKYVFQHLIPGIDSNFAGRAKNIVELPRLLNSASSINLSLPKLLVAVRMKSLGQKCFNIPRKTYSTTQNLSSQIIGVKRKHDWFSVCTTTCLACDWLSRKINNQYFQLQAFLVNLRDVLIETTFGHKKGKFTTNHTTIFYWNSVWCFMTAGVGI